MQKYDKGKVSIRRQQATALQDKNPSTQIAKRKNTCPIRFFFCHRRRKRKSYKKRKRRWGSFRALRSATVAADGSRRLLKKAGENFNIAGENLNLEQVFSVCTFFSILCNKIDKNAQSRRISVSSPYIRTAETDFGERKSEI